MKYDDASWHSEGNFPGDLPPEAGATHIGMFVAWAFLAGLAGDIHISDFPNDIPSLEARSVTPGAFFLASCDGKFTDEDLNQLGNAFTCDYFDSAKGSYLADYEAILGEGLAELYYVKDTWANFDRLKPVLDTRFRHWRELHD
jgi:hypothetical protein